MAEGNFVQAAIPKFDGHYDHWSMLMENLLRSKEYWSLVEEGVAATPIGASQEQLKIHEESKLKDLKAKNYLFQAIDRSIMETILDKSSAKAIWDSMSAPIVKKIPTMLSLMKMKKCYSWPLVMRRKLLQKAKLGFLIQDVAIICVAGRSGFLTWMTSSQNL
ncbi:hypothetical protein SESBI_06142 [Sesbania bispinosa]|nr:hypothetical protein SESBI_06142 [Sesbania bispinosa]